MNTQGIKDAINLCEDPETKGFDFEAGQSWVYPTNYPVRDYQFAIIQEALHKNTLVSLPTGLGKTFIAAVIMYNFYRWYPHGKVIFMAPTRPLVEQQIDACYNIMAIPQEVTAELTGVKKVQASRTEIWQNKRVFFITPQILQNDLESVPDLGGKIKCVVFDEAHRAKGNYAYCEVIRKLLSQTKLFRVLALSATPGNSVRDVLEVMENLLISHLEFRNEESPDVKPYVFERSLETVVVPLGEKLQQVKEEYEKVIEKYARTLIQYKIFNGNFINLTKGKIFMAMKEFQAKNRGSGTPNYGEIMKTLNICVTLYHAYEALIRCGLRVFTNFYEEHIKNPLINGNSALIRLLDDVKEYLGPAPNVELLPDGSYAPISASTRFGHPKFYQLRDVLLAHFVAADASSRVIVFFEYRDSVKEAYAILSQNRPTIKPRIFVGQGGGVKQRDQISTIKAFREGSCNTLLSTCIGEEGLDVGEVNLIVCFDITNKSPIRMIQRMGRTGRKKEGRIIALVTEGKEQQTLKDCLIYKNNLGLSMVNSPQLSAGKYKDNPKMIPSYIQPKCQKMFITVKKPVFTKNSNVRDMIRSLSFDSLKFADDIQIIEIKERIKNNTEYFWNKANPLAFEPAEPSINFSKHLEKQRAFQNYGEIKHSQQTDILVSLLQSADSKRFNIPVTQTFSKFSNFTENKNLKQGDIRSMFFKTTSSTTTEVEPDIPISQVYNFEKEKDITQSFPPELFHEITDFLSIQNTLEDNCKTCAQLFECPKFYNRKSDPIDVKSWVQPDLSIFENITARDLEVFADSLSPKSAELYHNLETNDIFDNIQFTQFVREEEAAEEFKKLEEKSFAYETPKGFENILNSFRICEEEGSQAKPVIGDNKSFAFETLKSFGKILKTTEICEDDTPVRTEIQNDKPVKAPSKNDSQLEDNYRKILEFFKLSSIEELYEDNLHDKTIDSGKTLICTPQKNMVKSPSTPDIFEESPDLFPPSDEKQYLTIEDSLSPVLCSYETAVQKSGTKKKLFDDSSDESSISGIAKKPNLANLNLRHKNFFGSKSTLQDSPQKSSKNSTILDISDICDLSEFGLGSLKTLANEKNEEKREKSDEFSHNDLDISDICDLSIFGLTKTQIAEEKKTPEKENHQVGVVKPVNNNNNEELKIDDICDMSALFDEPVYKKKDVMSEAKKKDEKIDDICDMSALFDEPVYKKKDVMSEAKKKDETITNGENKISDLSDFCDLSSFLNIESQDLKKNEPKSKISIVDLTDSDFDSSPMKIRTQPANKPTQLSITQVLSLVAKTDDGNKNNRQKENSSSSLKLKKNSQKSILSLNNNKKGVLQMKQNFNTPKSSQTQKKINKTPKATNKFNISLASNSDDEFEETTSSPIFARPKPIPTSASAKKNKHKKPTPLNHKKPKKLFREFLDEEAVLSDEESVVVSEDEDSGEDCFEASFVADDTLDCLNTTSIQAEYLKTIRSPPVRGGFKIPRRPKHNIINVFSQEVDNADETYMNDSFVVNTEEVDSPNQHELSELEILEMKLNKMKKNKKRKSDEKANSVITKRRRILMMNDDSD